MGKGADLKEPNPYAWMSSIDRDRVDRMVQQHPEFEHLTALIRSHQNRDEIDLVVQDIAGMFDLTENTAVAEFRRGLQRRFELLCWYSTGIMAAILLAQLIDGTALVVPVVLLVLASVAYGIYLQHTTRRELHLIDTGYQYRKCLYIKSFLESLGYEAQVETLPEQ